MKVLVIGDLHGKSPKLPKKKDFDCIVVVGDICSDKDFRPYWKKVFRLAKKNPNIFEEYTEEKHFGGKRKLKAAENRSIEEGNKLLKKLDEFNVPIFMVPGNWDQSYGGNKRGNDFDNYYSKTVNRFNEMYSKGKINSKLSKGVNNLKDCHLKNFEFEGVNFLGYGLSSAPEEFKESELSKSQIVKVRKSVEKLQNKLINSYKKRKLKKSPTFFILHNVPYNTKLDKIDSPGSFVHGKHFGSIIARKFCIKYKPLICVGGHIHEGKGKDKIGKTIVVNTGFGRDSTVLIDIEVKRKKVKKVEFVS